MNEVFRKANLSDIAAIWTILQHAIQRMKKEGSKQWQDGYPNAEVIYKDLHKGAGYVVTQGEEVIAYCAVCINDEPAYAAIEGNWLTSGDFIAVHRVAVSETHLRQGVAQRIFEHIEKLAFSKNIPSIKADTNYDNAGMITLLEKLNYVYCGEVYFRGAPRKAFEKVLKES